MGLDALVGGSTQVENPKMYEQFFDRVISDAEKGAHRMSDKNHNAYMRVVKKYANEIKSHLRKLRLEGKPNTDLREVAVKGVNKILAAVQPIFVDEASQNREMRELDEGIAALRLQPRRASIFCVDVMRDFGPATVCHRILEEPLRDVDDVVRECIAAEDGGMLPKGTCSEAFVSSLRHVTVSDEEEGDSWFQMGVTPDSDQESRPAGLTEVKADSSFGV